MYYMSFFFFFFLYGHKSLGQLWLPFTTKFNDTKDIATFFVVELEVKEIGQQESPRHLAVLFQFV